MRWAGGALAGSLIVGAGVIATLVATSSTPPAPSPAVFVTTTSSPPSTSTSTSSTSSTSSSTSTTTTVPAELGEWWRVAMCEEHGADDPIFGYFGIYPSTWAAFGGTVYAPTAGGATELEQVDVAETIQADAGLAGYVPDAYGCAPW